MRKKVNCTGEIKTGKSQPNGITFKHACTITHTSKTTKTKKNATKQQQRTTIAKQQQNNQTNKKPGDWLGRAGSFVKTAFSASEMSQEERLETINQDSLEGPVPPHPQLAAWEGKI